MDCPRPPVPSARSLRRASAAVALALALGIAAPAGATPGAPVAPAGGDPAQARDLYKKGKKAYDDGNIREAYEAYVAAWKLQKTFDIAGNLAAVEMETARYRDAAEHLQFALTNLPVSGDADKRRSRIESLLRDAKKQIGTFQIKVTPDFAQVSVDGHALTSAERAAEVFVDPGDHVVSATAQDHAPLEHKVHIGKGEWLPVALSLPVGGSAHLPPSAGPRPLTVAGFIASGLGLAAGTALAIVSKTKADAAETQFDALAAKGPTACAGPSPSDVCKALHDARASRDTFANAAVWTFVGATAIAGGTLVYTLLAPRSAPKAPSGGISALPTVSPRGGGLIVTGSF